MVLHAYRFHIAAEGRGRHRGRYAGIQRRRVAGHGASARLAHQRDALRVYRVKVLKHAVYAAAHVPAALAHQRAAQQQRRHGALVALRALRRAAALAERALLHDQRRLTARHYLPREVAVAARYGLLVAGIQGAAQRDMRALGVALQADDQRQPALRALGQQQMAAHVHLRLAGVAKAYLVEARLVALPLHAEGVVRGHLQRQAQQLLQPGPRPLLPGGKVLALSIGQRARRMAHQLDMALHGIIMHTTTLLSPGSRGSRQNVDRVTGECGVG